MIKQLRRLTNIIKGSALKCSLFYFIGCMLEKSISPGAVKKPMLGIQLFGHIQQKYMNTLFSPLERGDKRGVWSVLNTPPAPLDRWEYSPRCFLDKSLYVSTNKKRGFHPSSYSQYVMWRVKTVRSIACNKIYFLHSPTNF